VIAGIPAETAPGERRVALTPDAVKTLVKDGIQVVVQAGAGASAGFDDASYTAAGARVTAGAAEALAVDLVLKVAPPTEAEISALREGAVYIGFLRPLDAPAVARRLAERRSTAFALELVPRITRAQSMDALSSQANLAGYRAVLIAALALPRIFPMLVTAAGTIQPARVFVIGAGVAGLQAIATARRLGAIIEAYDTRPVVAEQVQSLGARFVTLDLDTGDAQDAGGYAKAQTEEFYQKQRAELGKKLAHSDVVITTALVPGQRAPLLIDEAAVRGMKPGSVIVDLASENGGNCACTDPAGPTTAHGVQILPGANLASDIPANASQMYARNLTTFVKHLAPKGELVLDLDDEITRGSMLTHAGQVTNDRVKALLQSA
jgi:NAD(P) transhydrogenase subunit alpha